MHLNYHSLCRNSKNNGKTLYLTPWTKAFCTRRGCPFSKVSWRRINRNQHSLKKGPTSKSVCYFPRYGLSAHVHPDKVNFALRGSLTSAVRSSLGPFAPLVKRGVGRGSNLDAKGRGQRAVRNHGQWNSGRVNSSWYTLLPKRCEEVWSVLIVSGTLDRAETSLQWTAPRKIDL